MRVGIDVTTLGGEAISGVGFHIIRLLEAIETLIDDRARRESYGTFGALKKNAV